MAYFSSGSEVEDYRERWCVRCIHYPMCPILLLHSIWNYEQHDNEDKKEALDTFIPRSRDGFGNEMCRMFVAAEKG